MSTGNWGPQYGVTKDEHDAVVARRGRPYTADSMRKVARHDDELPAELSPIDNARAQARRGTR